jgi:hypothetical protein
MTEADVTDDTELDVFCSLQGDAYRAYFRPGWLPKYLRQHLDEDGEAYPAHLDFDDLERHMRECEASVEIARSKLGGLRLVGRGVGAEALAAWLAGVFGTAIRSAPGGGDDDSPATG